MLDIKRHLQAPQKLAVRKVQMDIGDEHPGQDAHHIGKEDQKRHDDHQGHDPRQHQKMEGIKSHDPHGVDLLGYLHHPKLGGIRGPGAAGDNDGRDQGREFTGDRDADHIDNEDMGPEFLQLHRPLIGDHHPDQKAGQGNNRHRPNPGLFDIFDDRAIADGQGVTQGQEEDDEILAKKREKGDHIDKKRDKALAQLTQEPQETGGKRSPGSRRDYDILAQQPIHLVIAGTGPDDLNDAVVENEQVIIPDKEHHPRRINPLHRRDIPEDRSLVSFADFTDPTDTLFQFFVHLPQSLDNPVAAAPDCQSAFALRPWS